MIHNNGFGVGIDGFGLLLIFVDLRVVNDYYSFV